MLGKLFHWSGETWASTSRIRTFSSTYAAVADPGGLWGVQLNPPLAHSLVWKILIWTFTFAQKYRSGNLQTPARTPFTESWIHPSAAIYSAKWICPILFKKLCMGAEFGGQIWNSRRDYKVEAKSFIVIKIFPLLDHQLKHSTTQKHTPSTHRKKSQC